MFSLKEKPPAMKCPVCQGRTVKTETGRRCMNSACEGAKEDLSHEGSISCRCGETMMYSGINQLGEPEYRCTACGNQTTYKGN